MAAERAQSASKMQISELDVDIHNGGHVTISLTHSSEHSMYSKRVEAIFQMRRVAIVLLELELRRLKVWFDPISSNTALKDIIIEAPKKYSDVSFIQLLDCVLDCSRTIGAYSSSLYGVYRLVWRCNYRRVWRTKW